MAQNVHRDGLRAPEMPFVPAWRKYIRFSGKLLIPPESITRNCSKMPPARIMREIKARIGPTLH